MLDKGMIFASDSRTNAGVDNFAKFCKMTVFERRGNRVIVLLSSGNLAGTQSVISVLTQRCVDGDAAANLLGARTMFDVVRALSRYLKCVVALLIVKLWRWISVGSLGFQAAAWSAVTSRQTAKRSAISVRH